MHHIFVFILKNINQKLKVSKIILMGYDVFSTTASPKELIVRNIRDNQKNSTGP